MKKQQYVLQGSRVSPMNNFGILNIYFDGTNYWWLYADPTGDNTYYIYYNNSLTTGTPTQHGTNYPSPVGYSCNYWCYPTIKKIGAIIYAIFVFGRTDNARIRCISSSDGGITWTLDTSIDGPTNYKIMGFDIFSISGTVYFAMSTNLTTRAYGYDCFCEIRKWDNSAAYIDSPSGTLQGNAFGYVESNIYYFTQLIKIGVNHFHFEVRSFDPSTGNFALVETVSNENSDFNPTGNLESTADMSFFYKNGSNFCAFNCRGNGALSAHALKITTGVWKSIGSGFAIPGWDSDYNPNIISRNGETWLYTGNYIISRIETTGFDGRFGWGDYIVNTTNVYKNEGVSVEDINLCKIDTEIQDAPACEYESTSAPVTNEYLMLYDDNDNLLFQGWWDRPQWDGEISYHSKLKSPAIQDLMDSHIDEDWTATTETVIIKDILDTHCWFLTYDATSISGSGTAIKFKGKGLTVREALDRLAVQDLRGWYITPDLIVHFDTLTNDSGVHLFYGVELGTYKAKSQTAAWLLTWTSTFDSYAITSGLGGGGIGTPPHTNVLYIADDNTDPPPPNSKAYIDIASTDDVWISMWLFVPQIDNKWIFLKTMTTGGAAINDLVYFETDGKIYYEDGAAATDDLGAYVADTWYHFAFHFVKNSPIVVYRDNVLVTTTKSTANASTVRLQIEHVTATLPTTALFIDAYYYGTSESDARISYHLVNNAISMNRAPVVDPLKYSKAEAYGPYVSGVRLYTERFREAGYNSIRLYASHVTTQGELEAWLDNFLTKNNAEVTQYDFQTNGVGMPQVGEQANVLWCENPWAINSMTMMYMKALTYDALADNVESVIVHDIFYFITQSQAANDPNQQFQQETKAQLQDNTQNIEQLAGQVHDPVTVAAPLTVTGQLLNLENDAAAEITGVETTWTDSDVKIPTSKAIQTKIAAQLHAAVTIDGTSPLSLSTQAISLKNDASNAITEVDTDTTLAGGNTKIPTDAAVKAYMDGWSLCFGAKESGATTCANNSWTRIAFGTEDWDYGTCFSSPTFTVPANKGGIWHFDASVILDQSNAWSAGEDFAFGIYVDGSLYRYGMYWEIQATSTIYVCGAISCDLKLTAGQTVEIYLYQQTGGNVNTAALGWFNGHLVRLV